MPTTKKSPSLRHAASAPHADAAALPVESERPGTRGAQLESRCQKFVEVAEALFLEHGFAGTSVNEVVRQAGGSLSTLYGQYGNKEELFEAVMNRRMSRLYEGIFIEPESASVDGDASAELLGLAKRMLSHILSESSLKTFRIAVHEGHKFPVVRHAMLERGLAAFLARLTDYFAGLKGRLDIDDPALAAEEFMTLVQGQLRLFAACGDGERLTQKRRDDHVDRVVKVFLRIYPPRR